MNTLGESSKKYVEDVEFMTAPIIGNFENEQRLRDAVLQTLFAVVTEQPQKVLHISGLVQVVNAKNPSIGKTVAEFFHQQAQDLIEGSLKKGGAIPESSETGPWNKIKLILRFLSTLSTVVKESSLVILYQQFLKFAIDLQNSTPNKRNPLAEAIYYNTLISVPYLVSFTAKVSESGENVENLQSEELRNGITEILKVAEDFKYVEEDITITKPFIVDAKVPYEPKNVISLILPAVKNILSDSYRRVYGIFPQLRDSLQHLLTDQEKYSLPQFRIPPAEDFSEISGLDTGLGSVDGMWRTPRLTFEVYLPIFGFDTVPKSDDYLGLLFDDIVIDIVEALEFNRKEVARQIITLDLFFAEGVFAPPATNVDQLKEINARNIEESSSLSTWKTEDVAIKNVLSLIFKLPTVSQPFAYFYTTLVEACTNAAQAIAPVLGRAIRFFYTNIHAADFELRFRYLDWLAVQLSNFNFTWKWREWEGDSSKNSKSTYHPRVAFIRNLISKELRLATPEKIQHTLTEEFYQYLNIDLFTSEEIKNYYVSLLGDQKLENVSLDFEKENHKLFYLRENVPFREDVENLIEVFHKSASSEEYHKVLEGIKEKLKDYSNPDETLISLVFQTIAFVGNRSVSHAGKYVGNTFEFLRNILGRADINAEAKENAKEDVKEEIRDEAKDQANSGEIAEANGEGKEDETMANAATTSGKPTTVAISEEESLQRQLWAIDSVLKYWNSYPENGYLVLDVLESYDVLSPSALIKYSLDDSHRINFGLINVAATESIFRLLTGLVFSGRASTELSLIYKELIKIISSAVKMIGNEGEIPVPDVDAEYQEKNEAVWKYHTSVAFLRSVLRKFSDEYVNSIPKLEEILSASIEHEPTKALIKKWFDELKSL